MRTPFLQHGLSLVEMMVALAISSFLIIGVTQIYVDNKRSYLFQQGQSENQEGNRYALLLLQQELNKAGYRRRTDQIPEDAFPTLADGVSGCGAFKAGQTVQNLDANSFCIRYQPSAEFDRDCLGNLAENDVSEPYPDISAVNEIIVERFYIANDALLCQNTHVNRRTGAALRDSARGELVIGLADFRLQFGVASNSDPRSLDRYLNDGIGTNILAVRYTALMRSSQTHLRDGSDDSPTLAQWQTSSGASAEELTTLKAADKGQLYQFTQNTVALRNLLP